MKIGLIGSRKIMNDDIIRMSIQNVVRFLEADCIPLVFIGGESKGCERIAKEVVLDEGYDYIVFKPYNFVDHKAPHDPKYFFFRNKQIIDNSDVVLVFLEESETGVKKTIDYLKERTSKPYKVFDPNGIIIDIRGDIEQWLGKSPFGRTDGSTSVGV